MKRFIVSLFILILIFSIKTNVFAYTYVYETIDNDIDDVSGYFDIIYSSVYYNGNALIIPSYPTAIYAPNNPDLPPWLVRYEWYRSFSTPYSNLYCNAFVYLRANRFNDPAARYNVYYPDTYKTFYVNQDIAPSGWGILDSGNPYYTTGSLDEMYFIIAPSGTIGYETGIDAVRLNITLMD